MHSPPEQVDGFPDISGDEGIDDETLIALALGADPDTVVADDALPLAAFLGFGNDQLPSWYMPSPEARTMRGWRASVVVGLVASFLVLEAVGLCTVFGHVVVG